MMELPLKSGVKNMNYNTYLGYILPGTKRGQPGGVAELNNSGKVPSSQLPSYVDEIEEYNQINDFPLVGEKDIIYLDKSSNIIYRWSGSQYIKMVLNDNLNISVTNENLTFDTI